jgi:hypothetical protein
MKRTPLTRCLQANEVSREILRAKLAGDRAIGLGRVEVKPLVTREDRSQIPWQRLCRSRHTLLVHRLSWTNRFAVNPTDSWAKFFYAFGVSVPLVFF